MNYVKCTFEYLMLYATQVHIVKIWSYISLTEAAEKNIIEEHFESDPPELTVCRRYNLPFL